jgi:simple sugar transport system ATP-binding protein
MVLMRDIWKRFPGVVANKGLDLELRVGEVHALLGENGAGKTTLMNILAGIYRADEGEIWIGGEQVEIRSPVHAINLGVGMVHQHFRLVDDLTVAENVHLGWKETPWHISRNKLGSRLEAITAELKYQMDPNAQIWQLSVGEQQRVEILKVLARGARVLILDEPTAVLTPNEVRDLFRAVRAMADQGRTVVFISHKLDEVLEVSDRVSVLRGGERVALKPTSECEHRMLARLMVGEDVVFRSPEKMGEPGAPILEVKGISALNDRRLPALREVDLKVKQGEILGIAGVAGNGQRELAEVLTGLRPIEQGAILIEGEEKTGRSPLEFARAGVGHIPEDRVGKGLFLILPVTHNAILRKYREPPIRNGIRLLKEAAARFAEGLVERADVRLPHVGVPVRNLSGGNQQKLLTRREIEIASRLLVAVHPTRGLDVAATEDVRHALVEHRNNGNAVLLISEDLDEILLLSDRIAVMFDGRIVGLFDIGDAIREDIGLLMGGKALETEVSA